jgi:hypothetical protein
MSSGLVIQNANYAGVDVTSEVTKNIKDGILNMIVSYQALGIKKDPAPGQNKTLTVTYTINNGSSNTKTAKDTERLSISAPIARYASGLQIKKAEYGYTDNMQDVTDAVQSRVVNGSINMKISPQDVGVPDPNSRKKKQLVVEYTINGESTTETYPDGSTFSISAPPLEASQTDQSTPAKSVTSLIGILFKGLFYFIAMFLYISSVFIGIEFGRNFISPILFGILSAIIPLFAFVGIPLIAFWVTIFGGDVKLVVTQSTT